MKTSIICTGSSLKGFDLNSIEGHKIVVNQAYKYVDHYDILVALDNPSKFLWPTDKLHTQSIWNIGKGYQKVQKQTLIRDLGYFGSNGYSVFSAIEIALQHNYKHINIFGAEMKLIDGYCHFYDKEPLEESMKDKYLFEFNHQRQIKDKLMKDLLPGERIKWVKDPKTMHGEIYEDGWIRWY